MSNETCILDGKTKPWFYVIVKSADPWYKKYEGHTIGLCGFGSGRICSDNTSVRLEYGTELKRIPYEELEEWQKKAVPSAA